MGILQIKRVSVGEVSDLPGTMKIVTTDNLATVTAAGYFNAQTLQSERLSPSDVIQMLYSYSIATNSGTYGVFTVSLSGGVITVTEFVSAGDVLLPVVSGDFANFNGTTGQIKDAGYLPSDPSKTTVLMLNAATLADHIMVSTDTSGTGGNKTGTAINDGNIQAGRNTIAGSFVSFPSTTTTGSLALTAIANAGNFAGVISNASLAQSTTWSIPDPGAATANFLISGVTGTQHITSGNLQVDVGNLIAGSSGHAGTVSSFPVTAAKGSLVLAAVNNTGDTLTTISNAAMGQASIVSIPDPGASTGNFILSASSAKTQLIAGNVLLNSNPLIVCKVVTATFTQLATAGKVNILVAPSVTSQIAILDVKVFLSTGLSGGGGNRLLSLADGTLVFNNAGITAALLGTPIFTIFGGTGNPLPSSSEATVSTAGANVFLQYIGGTTDYTAGSVIIAVTYCQVTT